MDNEETEKIKQRIANLEYLLIRNERYPKMEPDYSFMLEMGAYVFFACLIYYLYTFRKEL